MSFKLNQLEITPDYDAHKDFSISFGKSYDYQTIQGGFPVAQVKSGEADKVSISFPLARETASAGVTLQNQVRELVKNPDIGEVYLDWSAATHLNGYYALESADLKLPTGAIDGGYAEFSARLTKIGEKDKTMRALQLNKASRTTSYGTNLIVPVAIHGFPIGASVFSSSGTFYLRSGSVGSVAVTKDATNQGLFSYDQGAGSIGLGDVRVYDDMGGTIRANWVEVYGPDHKFSGRVVLENTLLQVALNGTGAMQLAWFNGTSYVAAGTLNFAEAGNAAYTDATPKYTLGKVSPEESEFILSYPPMANSLKVRAKLKRGRWDIIMKPDFITGSAPAGFSTLFQMTGSFQLNYEADAVFSAGTANGVYAVAMASKNHIAAYNAIATAHAGMARTTTRTANSSVSIVGSAVNYIAMATGTDYVSAFVVRPPTGQDTPSNLGAQLLYDATALGQVVER